MANNIICRYCAAEFLESEPKCPYCGSTNYKGAEAQYFEKLEDVRDDMEDLGNVPRQETKKEIRKQAKFLRMLFLILIAMVAVVAGLMLWADSRYKEGEGTEKDAFLWKQEHLPIMDAMYEDGLYQEALEIFNEGLRQPKVYFETWQHYDFFETYNLIRSIQDTLKYEADGNELSESACTDLFYDQWKIIDLNTMQLDEEERSVLEEDIQLILTDFEARWNLNEEEYKTLYYQVIQEGYLPYDVCISFIDEWYKESN